MKNMHEKVRQNLVTEISTGQKTFGRKPKFTFLIGPSVR